MPVGDNPSLPSYPRLASSCPRRDLHQRQFFFIDLRPCSNQNRLLTGTGHQRYGNDHPLHLLSPLVISLTFGDLARLLPCFRIAPLNLLTVSIRTVKFITLIHRFSLKWNNKKRKEKKSRELKWTVSICTKAI